MAERLSDRVRHFLTINELASFAGAGYQGVDTPVGGGQTVLMGAAPGLVLRQGAKAGGFVTVILEGRYTDAGSGHGRRRRPDLRH